MLERVLEPEVMDTPADACEYDAMDHREVNTRFVADLLAVGPLAGEVLDLGAGTAQIPIELCRRQADVRVWAIDLAPSMLHLARGRIEIAGLTDRIRLDCADAKRLPYADGRYSAVISNSIVHHIPEPAQVLQEAWRVLQPGGRIFIRDLARPADETELETLVATYAAGATPRQRQLFGDSLRAALTLGEVQALIAELGCPPESVALTSDRHWTWTCQKPGEAKQQNA